MEMKRKDLTNQNGHMASHSQFLDKRASSSHKISLLIHSPNPEL